MTGQVACFTRAAGVADAQIDGETVLMSPTDRRCFGVNRTGSSVWELLPPADAAGVTAEHVVDRLTDAYDVERSVCLDEVTQLLAAMADAGVVASIT
jgi:hypothetical protein